jgi:hypothetical protein
MCLDERGLCFAPTDELSSSAVMSDDFLFSLSGTGRGRGSSQEASEEIKSNEVGCCLHLSPFSQVVWMVSLVEEWNHRQQGKESPLLIQVSVRASIEHTWLALPRPDTQHDDDDFSCTSSTTSVDANGATHRNIRFFEFNDDGTSRIVLNEVSEDSGDLDLLLFQNNLCRASSSCNETAPGLALVEVAAMLMTRMMTSLLALHQYQQCVTATTPSDNG